MAVHEINEGLLLLTESDKKFIKIPIRTIEHNCNCGEVIVITIGKYGGNSGRATCKCGAEMIVN